MTDEIIKQVRIQYPTNDPHSLQRSVTQIKELLENPEFWEAVGTQLGEVTIRLFSGGSGGGGVPFPTMFVQLNDTPGDYNGAAGKWTRVDVNETGIVFDDIQEEDIIDFDRTRWRSNWVQQTYEKNDVVLDWPYLMVANKQTDDPAAPQDVGPPFFVYTGTEPTQAITAKTLLVGNTYTAPNALKVPKARVYTVAGNRYSVYIRYLSTGQVVELLAFTAISTGWVEIPGPGNIIAAGTQFEVALYVTEPDPTPVTFVGNWNYVTPAQESVPISGQISHSDRLRDSLRVHKTDADGGDRAAELAGMTVGDTIEAGGTRWAISAITDNGTWIDFSVAPQNQIADGLQPFTFETVTASPITVVADPDFYLGNTDVRPFYSVDGGARVLTDDAYNVDIQIQEVSVSPDWDVMAISGSGGSGGGGGGSPWSIGDTFPTDPSPGDTHYKTAGVVGGYIYYDDDTSSQWVQINSGVVGPEGPQGPQGEKGTVSTDPPSGGVDGDVWYQVDP